jgi:hypothetical protein
MPQRVLQVHDPRRIDYERTIITRSIEFVCQNGDCPDHNQVVSREQYPGPTPRYCLVCAPIVAARANAERQARWRAARRSR